MKGGGFNKKNNKPHFDKPQSRAMTPPRVAARMTQFNKPPKNTKRGNR